MKTVHIVCNRLRGTCEQCPARHKSKYGWMVKGCYAIADELIRIVKTGGPFTSPTANRKWRKRMARYIGKEAI